MPKPRRVSPIRENPDFYGGVVLQLNEERYTSPMIAGRFQIMGSFIGNTFTVVDHTLPDLHVRVAGKGSDIRRFSDKIFAEDFINSFTTSKEEGRPSLPSNPDVNTQENTMAKPAVVRKANAAANAAMKAEPTKGKVPAKAEKVMNTIRASAKVSTPPETDGRKGRAPSTGGTMSAEIRNLISVGKLNDDQILEKVRGMFPDKKLASNAVKWHRAKMAA